MTSQETIIGFGLDSRVRENEQGKFKSSIELVVSDLSHKRKHSYPVRDQAERQQAGIQTVRRRLKLEH